MAIDTGSDVWRAITKFAGTEIDTARETLESSGLDAVTTENLRGRIKAMRDILALADPPDPIPVLDFE